jgi:hypothetical protein
MMHAGASDDGERDVVRGPQASEVAATSAVPDATIAINGSEKSVRSRQIDLDVLGRDWIGDVRRS